MTNKEGHIPSPVIELLTVANEFCLFTESVSRYPKNEVLEYYRKILPLLYIKGNLLPDELPEEARPERYVTEEQWEVVFNDIRQLLGEEDAFFFVDYSEPKDQDTWQGSLADHLADIYQDMKDYVLAFQKNTHTSRVNAIADCRRLFYTHWGERIVRAQHVIHQRSLQSHTESDPYLD